MKFDMLPLLTEQQLDLIHNKTVELLSRTGFRFVHEESISIFKENGFRIDKDIVYFTEDDINRAIELVGNQFTLKARNPVHDIEFNMDTLSIGMGGTAVVVVDPDTTCRSITMEDSIRLMKLAQMLGEVETWRPLLIPSDIRGDLNPPWLTANAIKYLDKPYCYMSNHELDIVRIGYGKTREGMARDAEKNISYGQSTISVLSPLTLGTDQCESMLELLRTGIVFNVAPMPSGGTTAPVTLAGEIIQQNVENLAPLVLCQLVRPGVPVLYGTLGSHSDMRTMASVFGSPETRILEYAAAQMARYYGMLSRGDVGITDASCPDYQAGAESMFQFVNVARAGINFLPGMGQLGSFMGGSLAKVVLDAELAACTKKYLQPVVFDENTMAMDIMEKVGPGGHFVTQPHTLKHCRSEHIIPKVFQRISYDAWGKKEYPTAMSIAAEKAEEIISSYEKPDIDPAMEKELDAYMSKTYGLKI